MQQRGFLQCGVYEWKDPTWFDFDVEFCRALTAALFQGQGNRDDGHLTIVPLSDQAAGFQALVEGTVDVVVGEQITLTTKYRKPTTDGPSWVLSTPHYYDNANDRVYGLATRNDDALFSGLVNWLIMALIYAEEEELSQSTATRMPALSLFGDAMRQAFVDCISLVGNYGDIYQRTMNQIIPREGRNLLNAVPGLGPQQLALPLV